MDKESGTPQARDSRRAQAGRTARKPDFLLTAFELREVTTFAVAAAAEVLPIYESASPNDARPRRAIEAAQNIVQGASRSKLQRITAFAAHRAAKDAPSRAAHHAAMAAGDAAASVYLHPLADAAQVNHILRAAAHAARATELIRTDVPHAAETSLETARRRATPRLVSVLSRYPTTPEGSHRVAQLMHRLDVALRDSSDIIERQIGEGK
ncbi:putative immunity protein [Micromonospora rubida]|uniref:putative immunity protein n=1 Tax=Micromonospora rubida TaxID=2697657 RepID=UPI002E2B57B9|nr:exonuclease SbcC [Micromonospora rubida]